MSDRILGTYVSVRNRIRALPAQMAAVIANESGQSEPIGVGLAIAGTIVLGGGLLYSVIHIVLPWIQNLFLTCLPGAGNGSTPPTGCP